MPPSSAKQALVSKRAARQQLAAQAAQLEERYQLLARQFRVAQVQFQAVRTQHRAVQQECAWLQRVVNAKQHVIEQLLPYYPHPLTEDLLEAITLY